jgi:hypothetical protein
MPSLNDADAVLGHLREALSGRTRWVFVTDDEAGMVALLALGLALIGQYAPLGVDADRLLVRGSFDFLSVHTGHRARLAFLTVPKAMLGPEEINEFLRLLRRAGLIDGGGPSRTDGGQDILVLCPDEPARVGAVACALEALRAGKAHPAAPADN